GSPPVSDEHPTHTYAENGTYTATLTLVVCQDTSVYTQEVQVQTVGSPPDPLKGEKTVIVYPNPAQNTLTFTTSRSLSEAETSITLYSITGQTVLQTPFVSTGSTNTTGSTNKTISVAHLPAGVYFYTVQSGGGAVLARGKVAVVR
ncbi:hypothetical protein C7N43_35920, partial [Sphingobacteriales bacterium UPWRP_1]